MKCLFLCMALVGGWIGCTTTMPMTSQAIFNGQDLTGWVVMHGGDWTVEDRVLVGRNGRNWSTDPSVSGSWLRYEQTYQDFILDLEYTVEGNSGILIRSGLDQNPAFTGYEMQILSDHGAKPSKGSSGGLYGIIAPAHNMTRPTGQWNQARILAEGPRIQVILNGELVVDYDEATRSTSGYIGLQNHDENSVVRFRNIRITAL